MYVLMGIVAAIAGISLLIKNYHDYTWLIFIVMAQVNFAMVDIEKIKKELTHIRRNVKWE